MLERFTDEAIAAIAASRDHARDLGHAHVGTEHLLLGVMSTSAPVAALLAHHDVTLVEVRVCVASIVTRPRASTPRRPPFTDTAKRALEWSLIESMARDGDYIRPDDLLAGLLHADGTAVAVLADLDADVGRIHQDLHDPGRTVGVQGQFDPDRPVDPAASSLPIGRAMGAGLFIDMLQASEDLTVMALEAVAASYANQTERLEGLLAKIVRRALDLGEEQLLKVLDPVIQIVDGRSGEVQLRPKPTDDP